MPQSFINQVLGIAKQESKRIFTTPGLWLLMLVVPLLGMLFMSMIYSQRVVVNIPIAIVDMDNSQLSAELVRSIDATRSLRISGYLRSEQQILSELKKGKIEGALYIPQDFSKNLQTGKSSTLVCYKNATNLIISNYIYKDIAAITQTFAAGKIIKTMQADGATAQQAYETAVPLLVKSQALPNWGYSYEMYLTPGLLPMFVLLCVVMTASTLFNTQDKNSETPFGSRRQTRVSSILVGKALPYFGIISILPAIMIAILFPSFHIYLQQPLLFYTFSVLLLLAGFAIGSVISVLTRDVLFANSLALFFSAPSMLFCGYTFPLEAMPRLHNIFAAILPFTHFMRAMLAFEHMQNFNSLAVDAAKLLIFIMTGFIISYFGLKIKYAKAHR